MKTLYIRLCLAATTLLLVGAAACVAQPVRDARGEGRQVSRPATSGAQLPDGVLSIIDSVSAMISDAMRSNHYASVLVLGVEGPGAQHTQLGMSIGDAFSSALEKRAEGFQVITRDVSRAFLESVLLNPNGVLSDESNEAICFGTRSEAYVVVKLEKIELEKAVLAAYLLKSALPTPGRVALQGRKKPQPGWRFEMELDQSMLEASRDPVNTKSDEILDGIRLPECVVCPTPELTDAARRNQFQGTLLLIVTVETDGKPGEIVVLKGAPYGMDKASVDTVKTWTFKPAKDRNGAAVVRRVLVTVTLNMY